MVEFGMMKFRDRPLRVFVGWEWGYHGSVSQRNTISFNRIREIGRYELSDMGGIYMLGGAYGTCVSNNWISGVKCYRGRHGFRPWDYRAVGLR